MKTFLKSAALVAIVAALPSLAYAQFTVRVDDGTENQVVITDGGTGDNAAAAGTISWFGTLGGADVSFVTALSKPFLSPNNSAFGQMDLNNVTVHGPGAGMIRFLVEDTSFGGTVGNWHQTGNFGGTLDASTTVSVTYGVNVVNNAPIYGSSGGFTAVGSPAGPTFLAGPLFLDSSAFSGSTSSTFVTEGGQFSMFQQVTVNYEGGSAVSFDSHQIAAIPEPETYAMMLAGLGLMGFIARRRKQNAAA